MSLTRSLLEELQRLGLSEKESRVYLSALKLGPSPVQVIARAAEVNRATTYVQIAALAAHGLMRDFNQGKKKLFAAEPPERLLALYEDEVRHLREKEAILKSILPKLKELKAGT